MSRKKKKSANLKIIYWLMGALAFIATLVFVVFLLLPNPDEFKTKNPNEWSMLRACREDLKSGVKISHSWIGLDRISSEIVNAVVISEDMQFFSHTGIDYEEILKVVEESLTELKAPRGASTISQQVVKNLYLAGTWSIVRKPIELILVHRLESRLSKRRILEIYLNIIEWGEGIFGVEAASRYYFNKGASQVNGDEAAFLAAIIPNPKTTYNPKLNPTGVKARSKIIRARMQQYNVAQFVR